MEGELLLDRDEARLTTTVTVAGGQEAKSAGDDFLAIHRGVAYRGNELLPRALNALWSPSHPK